MDDVLVADPRLNVGLKDSSGYRGLMSEARKYIHCHTTIANAEIQPERKAVMLHVIIVGHWEHGLSTKVPADANICEAENGGSAYPFS